MATNQTQHDGLLWGGYGFGNAGDELTLAVALRDLRRQFGSSIAILSREPEQTRRLFPDTDVIACQPRSVPEPRRFLARLVRSWFRRGGPGRFHLPTYRLADQPAPAANGEGQWRQAIALCRQLYLVGGGYLTDLFSFDHFLLPLDVARAFSVPVRTAPLGLGPFVSPGAAARAAGALAGVDLVVRDAVSFEFCQQHHLSARRERDDGFRVREVFPELTLPGTEITSRRRPRVGICVFRQHGDRAWRETRQWWCRLLAGLLANEARFEVEGFCFHSDPHADQQTLASLFAEAGAGAQSVRPAHEDFREALREVRRYDFIISARFHATVVAHELGIPHVGVGFSDYYAAKMAAAVRHGDPRCRLVCARTTQPEEIAGHVRQICEALAGTLSN